MSMSAMRRLRPLRLLTCHSKAGLSVVLFKHMGYGSRVRFFEHITTVLSVAVLVLVTGFGSSVQALMADYGNGHCDAHSAVAMHEGHADQMVMEHTGADWSNEDRVQADDCCTFLCSGLAFSPVHSVLAHRQFAALPGWPIVHLSPLNEPQGPDRPPNT
jgi:hypothetical protein